MFKNKPPPQSRSFLMSKKGSLFLGECSVKIRVTAQGLSPVIL